ncbi:MAG: DUF6273 domain-containing protein [Turicibacter sp.]|nr:DUF6273 domain-containing protein [Turicibacter sp.]
MSEFNSTRRRIKRLIIKKTHKWFFAGEPDKKEKFQEYVPRQSESEPKPSTSATTTTKSSIHQFYREWEKVAEVAEVAKVAEVAEAINVAEIPNVVEVPKVTEVPEVAEAINVAEIPNVVEVSKVTEVPKVAKIPKVTEVPEVGKLFNFSGYNWQVLDIQNDQALLLSEFVLKNHAYNTEQTDTTWENCTLRTYLNDDFYNKLADKGKIVKKTIQNKSNQWFDTSGGNNTTDHIFLLSLEEVVQYLGDSGQLQKKPFNNPLWIDDDFNRKRIAKDTNDAVAWWWLRSPGNYSDFAASVSRGGGVDVRGYRVSIVGGVRPALWINLSTPDKTNKKPLDTTPAAKPPSDTKPQQEKQSPKKTTLPPKKERPTILPPQKPKISAKIGENIKFSGYNWRVLDIQNNQALLLSELVLEKRAYNTKQADITWENCTLRYYLNNDFYNKLSAKGKIAQKTIPNKNNQWFGTASGNNTTDNIFLLSIEEVVKYLGDGDLTRPKMSEKEKQFWESRNWAKNGIPDSFKKAGYPDYSMGIDWDGNSKRVAKDIGDAAAWWLLRSPGYFSIRSACVDEDGYVSLDGNSVSAVGGVRPALWLNL